MLGKIVWFYLISLAMVFVITIYIASSGAPVGVVFSYALFGWPTAALVMLAYSKTHLLIDQRRTANRQQRMASNR